MDAVLERMSWSRPFDKGNGMVRRGRGFAIAIKAVTFADHLGRDRQRRRPTARRRSTAAPSTWGRARTPPWRRSSARCSTSPPRAVRVVPRDTDVTPYDMGTLGSRSLFHMGHAVRRAAEEARDKLKALAREVGEPEGSNIPIAELFRKRYGMQAGNVIGTGIYKPDYVSPAPGHRAESQRHAVLDDLGRRRRGGGRHRDRARQDHQAGQRRRLRQGDQSARSSRRRSPAPH